MFRGELAPHEDPARDDAWALAAPSAGGPRGPHGKRPQPGCPLEPGRLLGLEVSLSEAAAVLGSVCFP